MQVMWIISSAGLTVSSEICDQWLLHILVAVYNTVSPSQNFTLQNLLLSWNTVNSSHGQLVTGIFHHTLNLSLTLTPILLLTYSSPLYVYKRWVDWYRTHGRCYFLSPGTGIWGAPRLFAVHNQQ